MNLSSTNNQCQSLSYANVGATFTEQGPPLFCQLDMTGTKQTGNKKPEKGNMKVKSKQKICNQRMERKN